MTKDEKIKMEATLFLSRVSQICDDFEAESDKRLIERAAVIRKQYREFADFCGTAVDD